MSFKFLHEPGDPTLVMLHGTGGNEVEMLDFGKKLLPGVGYLSPRGNEPEHGMNRWFRRMGEGVFDIPNLIERTHELADFLDETLPATKRYLVGFSNGANIAAAMLLLRPESLDGAALLAPMVPLVPDSLPALNGKPVFMSYADNDPIVPLENVLRLKSMLEQAGANVSATEHSGGHSLTPGTFRCVQDWLASLTEE